MDPQLKRIAHCALRAKRSAREHAYALGSLANAMRDALNAGALPAGYIEEAGLWEDGWQTLRDHLLSVHIEGLELARKNVELFQGHITTGRMVSTQDNAGDVN